jgi:hypothetical protein
MSCVHALSFLVHFSLTMLCSSLGHDDLYAQAVHVHTGSVCVCIHSVCCVFVWYVFFHTVLSAYGCYMHTLHRSSAFVFFTFVVRGVLEYRGSRCV